jgi:outer membrane lipoprotein carrier protein
VPRMLSSFLRSAGTLAACCWLATTPAQSQTPEPVHDEATAEAAAELQRLLDATVTLRANFAQQVHDASGRLLEDAAGVVEIARPGRFRWTYEQPWEQLVVTDGEQVWMYDADLEQVSISRIDEALSGSPAMLLGGGRLAEGFTVTETWQREGLRWLVLVPREADGDFRRISLGHDGELVRRMELVDALGQVTSVTFGDIEPGVDLPAGRFAFEAPPGVDVIGPDGL